MSVLIHLDSAYVGFIFLVVTELVIVRVVIAAQLRSMDKAVTRILDKEGSVGVDLHEYGPFKVSRRSMRRNTIIALVLPAALILALIALGEFGISGRSVPTHSTSDTVTSGGYFFLDAVQIADSIYQRAPVQFAGKWPTCVEYAESSGEASQATVSYEIKDNGIEFGSVTCSEEVGVIVKDGKDLDSTCDHLDYNVTSIGGPEPVYNVSPRSNVNGKLLWNVDVYVGEVTTSSCLDVDGGPGKIFWVSADDAEGGSVITSAIVDDSFRLGDDSSLERWVVDVYRRRAIGSIGNSIAWDSAVIVECESGCLEAIVEWLLLDDVITIANLVPFFSIWYEGLNYVNETDPVCERPDLSNWIDDGSFNVGSCEGVVAEKVVLDGGQENVTLVSIWAICMVSIGCVLTLMYWFTHREAGHNLLTYEALSKAYYEEVNPGKVWHSGGALNITFVDCRLSAADKNQEV